MEERFLRNNVVIVRTTSIFIDKMRYKGVDQKLLMFNIIERPWEHIRQYATVVSVPRRLDNLPLGFLKKDIGKPVYETQTFHDVNKALAHEVVYYGPKPWYSSLDYPPMVIKQGDVIYFDYKCMAPPDDDSMGWHNEYYLSTHREGSKDYHYYQIPYDQIFLAVRYTPLKRNVKAFDTEMLYDVCGGGKVAEVVFRDGKKVKTSNRYKMDYLPVNGWVLVRPDYETWEDILIPTYYVDANGKPIKGADGKDMERPKEEWMVTKPAPGENVLQGYVEVIGENMKGMAPVAAKGDHVHLVSNGLIPVKVDGINYYRCHQTFILAKTDKKYKRVSNKDYQYIDYI